MGNESHRGVVVWITGLPASGKSTLAVALRRRLLALGRNVCLLDGDEVRDALVPAPGYDPEARAGFYGTLARVGALLAGQGLDVIVAATAHRATYRDDARRLAPQFIEVFVTTPAEECARRDPKGLWTAASRGALAALPGMSAEYERPRHPDVVAAGGLDADAVEAIAQRLVGGRA